MKMLYALIALGVVLYLVSTRGEDAAYAAETINRVEHDYYQDAADASKQFGIPYRRILAMIVQESGGAAEATGMVGERGLMQVTRGALQDFNTRYVANAKWDEMYEDRLNIFVGTGYLKVLVERLGSLDIATRAYNVGAANVRDGNDAGAEYLASVQNYERALSV